MLAIDSAAADGRDVSWLWDVDYEQLAGRTVIATGPRAQDLAVRLATPRSSTGAFPTWPRRWPVTPSRST